MSKKRYVLEMTWKSAVMFEATEDQIAKIREEAEARRVNEWMDDPEWAEIIEDVIGIDIHDGQMELESADWHEDD